MRVSHSMRLKKAVVEIRQLALPIAARRRDDDDVVSDEGGVAGEDKDEDGVEDDEDVEHDAGVQSDSGSDVPEWRRRELAQLAKNVGWDISGTALPTRSSGHCTACGEAGHKAPTCTKRNTAMMLQRAGVLPGQMNNKMKPEGWIEREEIEQLIQSHRKKAQLKPKKRALSDDVAAIEPGNTVSG